MVRGISYTDYSDSATGTVCCPGRHYVIYSRLLIDLTLYIPMDFYDLSEHLDDALEVSYQDTDYVCSRVREVLSGE